eukprot:scaffold4275_cov179-Ochromonas_danica.AAC.8
MMHGRSYSHRSGGRGYRGGGGGRGPHKRPYGRGIEGPSHYNKRSSFLLEDMFNDPWRGQIEMLVGQGLIHSMELEVSYAFFSPLPPPPPRPSNRIEVASERNKEEVDIDDDEGQQEEEEVVVEEEGLSLEERKRYLLQSLS